MDGGGSKQCALLGDNLATIALTNGWKGVIVHGCVRDSAQLKEMAIGVCALGTHPRKSGKAPEGSHGEGLSFAGVTVQRDDWLYADEDAIIVSRRQLH